MVMGGGFSFDRLGGLHGSVGTTTMSSQGNPPEEPLPSGPNPQADDTPPWYRQIQESTEDPHWPPFPTMSQSGGTRPEGSGPPVEPDMEGRKRVMIRPREKSGPAGHGAATPFSVPRELTFQCPSCLQSLKIPLSELHVDGPCPHCGVWICPPRVRAAGKGGEKSQPSAPSGSRKEIFRPNRDKAAVRFLKGEVRPSSGIGGEG
jgi:hypothetical protein